MRWYIIARRLLVKFLAVCQAFSRMVCMAFTSLNGSGDQICQGIHIPLFVRVKHQVLAIEEVGDMPNITGDNRHTVSIARRIGSVPDSKVIYGVADMQG